MQDNQPSSASPAIVGIGASAGGVKALQTFFQLLPPDTGAAFVVIMHLDPEHRSELPGILATRTRMPVVQVDGKSHLQGNHVYVISPNSRLQLTDHEISALPFEEPRALRAPIDLFFRSLAEQHGDALAVILTGAGADGSVGVRSIKEAGGLVLVQDPNEAEFASMPRSAIATEVADFILPLNEIADRVTELIRHTSVHPSMTLQCNEEEALRRILAHVRARTGHDFAQYKRATVLRRIARRAQVTRKNSLPEYFGFLCENVEEAQALYSDFLISVTSFFRDPKSFDVLALRVVPQLFEDKDAGSTLRVWVPGCATGEEAYSIGMLLLEEAGRRDIRPEIQVFGSDLDAGALATAREGCFPASIEADVSEERLRRFFQREGQHYRVRRELRDIVLFASHSLLRDPPFSRLDLISCRNLLIYLERDLQQQLCSTFHYAVKPGGFLFVGASESAEHPPGLFRSVDREARIYRSANGGERRSLAPLLLRNEKMPVRGPSLEALGGHSSSSGNGALHRQMLERIAPPSILVDESHRAVHLSESAGRYLQPSGGPVTNDATDMVRQELRFDLRTALHRAFEHGESTLSMPLSVRFDGSAHRVYLQVKPVLLDDETTRHALVLFIEGEAVETQHAETDNTSASDETVRQLQEELLLTRSQLRATREEFESTNQELRAANEELQSINEEYRSTSEELETSKEELQSINEELQTVNNELKLKLESVSRSHGDLQNLMAATDVGTLFLDSQLRIKRFTPRLTEIFNITGADEGRAITDFTHQLEYPELANDAHSAINELGVIEREVEGKSGAFFLVRIRPYRTTEDRIDGVVATFVDITNRRRNEEALRQSEQSLRQETQLVDLSRSPIFVWDFDAGVVSWNRGCEELFGFSRDAAIGQRHENLLHTTMQGASFEALKKLLLAEGHWSGELNHTTRDGRLLTVQSHIEMVQADARRLVLQSDRDITEQKQWERRRRLLVDDMHHRLRNAMAVVQSVARLSMTEGVSNEEFMKRFEQQLGSLARSHQMLMDTSWNGGELGALARAQLSAFLSADPPRLLIEGRPLMLPPDQATLLGLVLNELGTNAAKHGALSVPRGRVLLSWKVDAADAGKQRLTLTWQEVNGPRIREPTHRGFGTALMESGLHDTVVRRHFAPEGLLCTIEMELPPATIN